MGEIVGILKVAVELKSSSTATGSRHEKWIEILAINTKSFLLMEITKIQLDNQTQ